MDLLDLAAPSPAQGHHLLQPHLDLGLHLDLGERPHAAPLVLQPAGLDPLEQLQEILGVFRGGFRRLERQGGEGGSSGGNQHSDLAILHLGTRGLLQLSDINTRSARMLRGNAH